MELLDSIINFFRSSFWLILVIFIIFALMMYMNQDNLIFPTTINGLKIPEDNPDPWKSPSQLGLKYKEISTKTKDNIKLVGWLVYKDEDTKNKTLLYFHENAGNVGFRLPYIEYVLKNLNMNLIIFGYRGYGKSEGTPSEKGLYLDGDAVSDYVFNDLEAGKYVDRNDVYLFGRSLGGAVAACVALEKKFPFRGVIIENTFTTLGDLVDIMFPPLKFVKQYLLKSKFETINIIGKIKKPILFCRSECDELIPKSQMDNLFNSAKGAPFKRYYVIKNGTHNDGFRYDKVGYAEAINNFIKDCNEYYMKNSREISENNNEKDNNNADEKSKPKLD